MLTDSQKSLIQEELQTFLERELPFVAHEMYLAVKATCSGLEEKNIESISMFLRKLFDQGAMPSWACTYITPNEGTIMYFKVYPRSDAGRYAEMLKKRYSKG